MECNLAINSVGFSIAGGILQVKRARMQQFSPSPEAGTQQAARGSCCLDLDLLIVFFITLRILSYNSKRLPRYCLNPTRAASISLSGAGQRAQGLKGRMLELVFFRHPRFVFAVLQLPFSPGCFPLRF
jgi:hypothetical protein